MCKKAKTNAIFCLQVALTTLFLIPAKLVCFSLKISNKYK